MTPEQLSRIEQMASGSPTWDLSPNDIAALAAMLAEREAVLKILLPACHSGTNLRDHGAIYRALVAMGARSEAKDGSRE